MHGAGGNLVLGEDDAAFGEGVGSLLFVGRIEKTGLGRGRHVDAAASKSRAKARGQFSSRWKRIVLGIRQSFAGPSRRKTAGPL